MKEIIICDKHYNIDCSAYTYLQYKQVFKRGIFSDIQILKNFFSKQTDTIIKCYQKLMNL